MCFLGDRPLAQEIKAALPAVVKFAGLHFFVKICHRGLGGWGILHPEIYMLQFRAEGWGWGPELGRGWSGVQMGPGG